MLNQFHSEDDVEMSCDTRTKLFLKRRVRDFLALFVWNLCLLVFISYIKAERLPVKTYTVADGLLRDGVYKIKQDSRGFFWFCTSEGISRFDGVGMTNFTLADGLPDSVVEDFLETHDGTIYIATDRGLARLNPRGARASKENPLFTVFLPDNPKAEEIHTLYEDRNNQIWVGTSDGLYKLIETGGQTKFEYVTLGNPISSSSDAIAAPSPNTLYVYTILEDRRGTLWIGTFGSGLFRLSADGSVQRFTADNGFGDNKITALLEDRDGQIWMGMRSDDEGGVCQLDATDIEKPVRKCYRTKDGLPANRIRDMLEASDGRFWIATSRGLCHWQGEGGGSVCKTYTAKNDLCDEVFALAEDKDGNLWTGSSCGAKKIARYGFTTYSVADGLDYNPVNAIFENSAGELFVINLSKNERVISRFDGEKFSLVKPRLPEYVDYQGWGWEQTIHQDSRGAWWIPTGYGLFRTPDKTDFTALANAPLKAVETGAKWALDDSLKKQLLEKYGANILQDVKAYEIFRLFEDSRGDIWILTTTTANEILRWERATNTWHNYTSQTGISESRIGMAFVEDRFGNVWVGASSDHNDSALIRFRNGEFRVLSQAEGAPSGWIQDLFTDSHGRLWIGSSKEGVWRLDDTNADDLKFVKYTPANGLSSVGAASITEDEYGRIYIATWRGIDRLNSDTGQIENFTTADGLPASFVGVAYRDRKNNLWFGTDAGLARFVPEPPHTRQPPTILITGLRVGGETQSVSILGETKITNLNLSSYQRQVSIDFIGLGATLGEKLQYEYRLTGGDWVKTNERTVNFANLSSASYLFEIRAVSTDRNFSQSATVSFSIAAPIWQRWWFIALLVFLIAAVIYAFYRNRVARILEMANMRTRIATDLHDDIGANLTRISLLSEVAKQKKGNGEMLSSISDIARESVSSMNDIVWAISPEHDSLLDLTRRMRQHAEEVFTFRDIDLQFNAPSSDTDLKLSVGVRRDLLLIFKEAVNNAARHSNCSEVAVDFFVTNSILSLQVKDNGKGINSSLQSDGQGLRSMNRRALGLGGQLKIVSQIGEGTVVKFELPLQKVSSV